MTLEVLRNLGRCDDLPEVRRERNRLHDADLHVPVLELGLAGFDALRAFELDGDHRSALEDSLYSQPASKQCGKEWHQPYRWHVPPRATGWQSFGNVSGFHGV